MAKEEQIKSQIILEGEKEYRAACKGINTFPFAKSDRK